MASELLISMATQGRTDCYIPYVYFKYLPRTCGTASLRSVVVCVLSLDFAGWHGEHHVAVRVGEGEGSEKVKIKELAARRKQDCGNSIDPRPELALEG